jgi:purine-nucleoside phosphorylase
MTTTYKRIEEARAFLQSRLRSRPRVGVILGSGLGAIASDLECDLRLAYGAIPHWPAPHVEGHAGEFLSGQIGQTPVAFLSGRVHLYEGYRADEVAFGVRLLGALGVRALVLTNAAGGLRQDWKPPCLALLRDHINLQGTNPLVGPNDERFGPRFPDLSAAYSAEFRQTARRVAAQIGVPLEEGVYAGVLGPNYETPAEVRFLRSIGADMVGMSTVTEAIAARHMGIDVLGISVITNVAAGLGDQPIEHEEVLAAGREIVPRLKALLWEVIPELG